VSTRASLVAEASSALRPAPADGEILPTTGSAEPVLSSAPSREEDRHGTRGAAEARRESRGGSFEHGPKGDTARLGCWWKAPGLVEWRPSSRRVPGNETLVRRIVSSLDIPTSGDAGGRRRCPSACRRGDSHPIIGEGLEPVASAGTRPPGRVSARHPSWM
jgi:hypothetical protein